jgi:hypothetical protein
MSRPTSALHSSEGSPSGVRGVAIAQSSGESLRFQFGRLIVGRSVYRVRTVSQNRLQHRLLSFHHRRIHALRVQPERGQARLRNIQNRSRTGHAFPTPQRAQMKPAGHRSRARYARHASSVAKFVSNSADSAGTLLPSPHTTYWGHLSEAATQLKNL